MLCLLSPAIPVVLGWKKDVAVLPKLLRQVFWTYACYVLGAHLVFALISIFGARLLLDGGGLALAWTGFMGVWWGVRLVLHWTTFDTSDVPEGPWTKLAEWGLGLLWFGMDPGAFARKSGRYEWQSHNCLRVLPAVDLEF